MGTLQLPDVGEQRLFVVFRIDLGINLSDGSVGTHDNRGSVVVHGALVLGLSDANCLQEG